MTCIALEESSLRSREEIGGDKRTIRDKLDRSERKRGRERLWGTRVVACFEGQGGYLYAPTRRLIEGEDFWLRDELDADGHAAQLAAAESAVERAAALCISGGLEAEALDDALDARHALLLLGAVELCGILSIRGIQGLRGRRAKRDKRIPETV
jgi:hypothetical protein